MGDFTRGMPTSLYIGPTGRDEYAVLTLRAAAASGVTTLTIRSDTNTIVLANSEVDFGSLVVVATELVKLTAGVDAALPIQPLPGSLTNGSEAWHEVWHRVHGTSDTDLSLRTRLDDATPAMGSSLWSQQQPVQQSWTLDRRGRYHQADPGYQTALQAALAARRVRVLRVLPTPDGQPGQAQRGLAWVTDLSNPSPATGIVDASWNFQGHGAPEIINGTIPVHYKNLNY